MHANGQTFNYQKFYDLHADIYKTDIEYKVEYDFETFVETKDRLAGRVFITLTNPGQPQRELEVILIVKYAADKILRLWELAYPDWSKMPDFEKVSEYK